MITKFEIFEKLNEKPEIGDYVVCCEDRYRTDNIELVRKLDKFLSENVGCVKKIDEDEYLIQYSNCPKDLDNCFKFGYVDNWNYTFPVGKMPNCRGMNIDEIIYWSKNKEDCETFIAAKKYNL